MNRKFRAIVQSNLEPNDKQVIWLNEDYLRYYNNGEWVPLGRNKEDPIIMELLLNRHISNKQNPHSVTKEQIGLSNVTNDIQLKESDAGKPNGIATLDSTGKVPLTQLPDNIGEGNNLELGETSTTAYPGDKGKTNANAIRSLTNALDSIDFYSKTTRNQLDAFKNTKGQALGIVPLDENGKVASSYLPSYVDDVLEYNTRTAFPTTGESGKIYIALDTNKTYRWGGTTYAELTSSITLGETSSTAYAGDKGKKNREDINNLKDSFDSLANHVDEVNNKTNTNTTAIEELTTEVGNTNTEVNTINGKISKLNTTIGDVRSSFNNYASEKTPIIDKVEPHIANKQNPHEVTKAQVGLGNVTNDAQVKRSEMGANNGVATLDANGKVLESQLPAAVTYAANLPDNIVGGGKATAAENGIILSLDATNKENGSVSSKDILIPNADGTKTDGSGLMLNSDKTKLDSIKATNTTFITEIKFVNSKYGLQMYYYLRNLNNTSYTGYKTIPLASTTTNGIMSSADKVKLDSLSNYTLPTADSSTLGGVKIGSGLNIDSNGIISVHNSLYEFVQDKASLVAIESPDPNKIYIVLDDIAGEDNNNCTEYVWVVDPSIGANGVWEKLGEYTPTVNLSNFYNKTEIDALSTQLTNLINARLTIDSFNTWSETVALKSELDTKVDKVEGKGLSTNDYSNIDKGTVSKVKIIHPITGISVIPSASDVLLSLIKYDFPSGEDLDSNVSFPVATSTTAGLVTASDKAILEELKRTTDITSGFKAKSNTDGSITFGWKSGIVSGDSYNYTIPLASTTQSGLMSKEDKVKLDNLSSGGSSAITEYTEAEITALLKQIRF